MSKTKPFPVGTLGFAKTTLSKPRYACRITSFDTLDDDIKTELKKLKKGDPYLVRYFNKNNLGWSNYFSPVRTSEEASSFSASKKEVDLLIKVLVMNIFFN